MFLSSGLPTMLKLPGLPSIRVMEYKLSRLVISLPEIDKVPLITGHPYVVGKASTSACDVREMFPLQMVAVGSAGFAFIEVAEPVGATFE